MAETDVEIFDHPYDDEYFFGDGIFPLGVYGTQKSNNMFARWKVNPVQIQRDFILSKSVRASVNTLKTTIQMQIISKIAVVTLLTLK